MPKNFYTKVVYFMKKKIEMKETNRKCTEAEEVRL